MKKGFLSKKSQSLFDTTVQMKDVEMDHVVLDLDKSAIPESGTAKVRSRPTVNYFNSHTASDAVQGFAVPTPKVPVLPPLNGPQTNGTANIQQLQNGGMITVLDDEEGEIFIPPPPLAAPPPPPPQFIPPSPKFQPQTLYGDFEVPPELASLQPPPMPAPKPPILSQDVDLASLKPPPMAPPKPPSDTSSTNSAKASLPIYSPLSDTSDVPECPQFTPPPPPVVKQQPPPGPQKTPKAPPPKPVRMSSISSLEVPSASSSTPAPVPSSFNPQNTAKVYSIPKTTLLSGGQDRDVRPKSILLLEDSSGDSVRVQVNGNGSTTPSPAQTPLPPAKPVRRASTNTQLEKDLKDLKENLTVTLPGQADAVPSSAPKTQTTPNVIPTPPKPAVTPPKVSPKLQKQQTASAPQESNPTKPQEDTREKTRQYSPLLTHKLNNIKASESSGTRESGASPLALLMAAKKRERQRSGLSRENSTKSSQSFELPAQATIQPSESKPNSFIVIPKSTSSSSLNLQERLPVEKPDLPAEAAVPVQPQAPVQVTPPLVRTPVAKQDPKPPVPSTASAILPSDVQKKVLENQDTNSAPAPSEIQDQEDGDEFCVPFIPPPPEFANSDPEDGEGPPSTPPPDPPTKVAIPPAPAPAVVPPPPPPPSVAPPINPVPVTKGPPTAQKPKPPIMPKFVPSQSELKAKLSQQTNPKLPENLPSTPTSANQATLLSILQKKMLEMDPKLSVPVKEADNGMDDWGTAQSDEEDSIPVPPKPTPKAKSTTLPPQASRGLDMRELEIRVAQKAAENVAAASKSPASNGSSKQSYGMTFTVRPGTKQPITVVSKGDS